MSNFKLSWDNFFGNEPAVDFLRKNIAENIFPHAVIFSGVEGVGKRLAAEICAAALLCENPRDGSPCGVCDNCMLTAAHTHPDLYIVEAEETKTARNIKIGQIRDMQSEAALMPINSARRVVIIDGAELMNKAAANCLLKTLEEPPGQTIFILLTTNLSSLLMTIRSRCGTVRFDKLSAARIRDVLLSRGVDDSDAEKFAAIANGSLGQALKFSTSDGAALRDRALDILNKLVANELTNEEIFTAGAKFADWSREKFANFIVHLQRLLRDVCFVGELEPYNSDVAARLAEMKLPERKIFLMIETGVDYRKRLRSNANLRLLAEAYLFQLRKIYQQR